MNSIIIIGAPRSGTNMLRNVLCSLSGVATWPCDEINYIWRHGNVHYPSDEFKVGMARPKVCKYVRRKFNWVASNFRAHTVVEKTCANSLRVEFVNQIMPEAQYIFIRRDGLDVVGSAMKRWKAKLDVPYLARKARFVPAADLPYYGYHFFLNRIYRIFSKERRLAYWGPKLNNMQEILSNHPLDEICAIQWRHCVESAAKAFDAMDRKSWIEVSYEDFVSEPKVELERLLTFLDLKVEEKERERAISSVKSTNIGKDRKRISVERLERLKPLICTAMTRYGYL